MQGIQHAELEFGRIRRAVAWSPVAHVAHRSSNQYWCAYTFSDGSRLELFANGNAAWYGNNGRTGFNEAHHHCNSWGRA